MNHFVHLLDLLTLKRSLDEFQSQQLLGILLHSDIETQCEILTLLKEKGESITEINGFIRGLTQLADMPGQNQFGNFIDVCGTGGDGLNTFNVTTAAAFIAAGAGVKIAKSGSRSMSSQCGSFDVLDALHISSAPVWKAPKFIRESNPIFVATGDFVPGLAKLREARKRVGGITICNLVGPLLNPLKVSRRLIGVPSDEKAQLVAQFLYEESRYGSIVVTGENGEDEITLAGNTFIYRVTESGVKKSIFNPATLGLKICDLDELKGGATKEENAQIIRDILQGTDTGPRADMVLCNATAILAVSHCKSSITPHHFAMVKESIASGKAYHALKKAMIVTTG